MAEPVSLPPGSEPIGPLTAQEWCAFRMRDNDLLQCCGVTSDMRDVIFYLLRMGAEEKYLGEGVFREAWDAMVEHGLPEGEGGVLLRKLHDYYLGDEGSDHG